MMGIDRIRECLLLCLLCSLMLHSNGFTNPIRSCQQLTSTRNLQKSHVKSATNHRPSTHLTGYTRPQDEEQAKPTPKKLPTPKIGDIVRYYDIDGGNLQGQILVGKISLIQPIAVNTPKGQESTSHYDGTNRWLVEITQMEDVGDGYYAEYPSRKRRKVDLRKLEDISPLAASFVRTENAYKIPMERGSNIPMAYAQYDLINYEGPKSFPVDNEILAADGEVYNNVKFSLLKNTALAGLAGTIVADLARGTEDAVIYFAGATAGVLYLYFLGIKTDTVGSVDAKLGANVSNLRFVFPALVLIGVALNNVMSGNPELDGGLFSTVTPEQFGAAMIGFLTYRVPLFISHLFPVLFDSATDMLPGSAGMAVRMAAEAKKRGVDVATLDEKRDDGLVTVLLVSGPEGTGKTTLVNKLIESDDRFVRPIMQDRVLDQMRFERMEERDEFLSVDESGRYGLSKDGVLQAATKAKGTPDEQKVVVLDAKVSLARKLSTMYEVRIVGVWVGLDSLEKFESRLKAKMQSGGIEIPEGQTEDSVLRAKVNQAIKDIEYGVTSGLFEFTILNEDIDESVKELKDAAGYCFK
ncbi:hypothetical protein ACHAXN_000762 [Cyclotella atomus]